MADDNVTSIETGAPTGRHRQRQAKSQHAELTAAATAVIQAKHILRAATCAHDSGNAEDVDFGYIAGAVAEMLDAAGVRIDSAADAMYRIEMRGKVPA